MARLVIQNDSQNSPVAWYNLSPVRYDATGSSGVGLTCVIDFGDGTSADGCSAVHFPKQVPNESGTVYSLGELNARVTVTDRLGRTSTAQARNILVSFNATFSAGWRTHPDSGAYPSSDVVFMLSQDGQSLKGWAYSRRDGSHQPVSGRLSGERDIAISRADGVVYTGILSSGPLQSNGFIFPEDLKLILTTRGGVENGKTTAYILDDVFP